MQTFQVSSKNGRELKIPMGICKTGVSLEDEFTLDVFQKGRRELKFNRTSYQVIASQEFKIDFQHCIFYLPTFNQENFHCKFDLIKLKGESSEGVVFVESLNSFPFRLNGNWCFEAFLEKGDILEIGFNKFHFKRDLTDRQSESSLGSIIPYSIIKSKIPIVLEGETGTGKTRLAKMIHEESNVPGNFIHLNLSSFSKNLIESELFGHIKGSYTGAINDKKGAILEASKGTLFLDEIDSLSLDIQTKLLIFLESMEFRPVGSERVVKVDTRIIVASGTKLIDVVENKSMRKDFYYRLKSGHSMYLESLREKRELIKDFCDFFEQNEFVVLSDELKKFYCGLSWPGNIRQLKSHLMKKKILSNGKKIIYDETDVLLIEDKIEMGERENKFLKLDEVKFNYCQKAFNHMNQNYQVTSKILDISQNTLRSILKKKAA